MFTKDFSVSLQARDEEKNRRNNTDSTNQVMKDLEDLLPNKSLIPPAPPPEPGQSIQMVVLCRLTMLNVFLSFFLVPSIP